MKLLDIVTPSFMKSFRRYVRCSAVSAERSRAVSAMPRSSVGSQYVLPPTRTSSTKTMLKIGATEAGRTSRKPARTRKTMAALAPAMRPSSEGSRRGRRPSDFHSAVGWKVSTTPVKAWSNSSSVTMHGPLAGSFRKTLFLPNPSTTKKWLKFQCTMTGIGISRTSFGSLRKPRASSPYSRAALRMLLALLPSRETPHSSRTLARGTNVPWYSSTVASAAAPHSVASI